MATADVVQFTCTLPRVLHTRAKRLTKGAYGKITELIRRGLENEVILLEERRRIIEGGNDVLRPANKRGPKRSNTLANFHDRSSPTVEVHQDVDRLGPIFTQYAERILHAWQNPEEVERRKFEAFAAIKRAAPLTYGDENKITARLEALIAEKAAMLPPPTVEDYRQPLMARPFAPLPSQTAVDAREVLSSLANLMRPETFTDPLAGRAFNPSRIRRKAVVQDDDNQESGE